jgi:hypothetical protein
MSAYFEVTINTSEGLVVEPHVPVVDNLSEGEYVGISDAFKSESKEYVRIEVFFDVTPARDPLLIMQA